LRLGPRSQVLDIASGRGGPALVLARAFGCSVEGVEIKYGLFINAIIQFTITAIALFFLIKAINMVRKPASAVPGPSQSEIYLKEIRDALVKGKA